MRSSSRRIIQIRRQQRQAGALSIAVRWLIFSLFIWVVFWWLHRLLGSWLVMLGVLAAAAVFIAVSKVQEILRQRALAEARSKESICDFARAFPRRTTDPLVLRAVYESVQDFLGPPSVPIRASDRLMEDLQIDDEALIDLLDEVSDLAGRSTDDLEKNPHFGKVETVGDLVRCILAQPLLSNSISGSTAGAEFA